MNLKCKVQSVGIHKLADFQAVNIECNHRGSDFDVLIHDQFIHFHTSLLGEHNILNCLFAIAVGIHLNIEISLIQLAISNLKPIEHRLELKSFYKGVCIDNAYNSNPGSAKASLEVLKLMPKRHLIITPGFIDLGKNHEYYSIEFGHQMSFCDIVILIKECKEIRQGLLENNFNPQNIYHVSTMKEALYLASQIMQENDTLLIENDIPEILENT